MSSTDNTVGTDKGAVPNKGPGSLPISQNHRIHPFYIFGSGMVLGIIGASAFWAVILDQGYVAKDKVYTYLSDQKQISVPKFEWDRMQKDITNLENDLEKIEDKYTTLDLRLQKRDDERLTLIFDNQRLRFEIQLYEGISNAYASRNLNP